ncbi:MAG: hypothetical protein HY905_15715 [Deltaproteobacteria bacterium]|nr:hypothetical protein [Deltaproteobacteria bacterium]
MTYENAENIATSAARDQFESIVRSGALRVCERAVYYSNDCDDRVQEGLAQCWAWFRQQAMLGHTPDVALVVHVAKLRTKDRGRRFVSGDGTRWGEDVYIQQERGVDLRRLDGVPDHDDDDERHEDRSLGLARPGIASPEANVLSAMDLGAWFATLSATDGDMLELRYEGFGLEEVGKATGRSTVGVFRRCRRLGVELAERAGISLRGSVGRHLRRHQGSDRCCG